MNTLPRLADETEAAFIRVNEETRLEFGTSESNWTADQVREYLLRLDAARMDPEAAVA